MEMILRLCDGIFTGYQLAGGLNAFSPVISWRYGKLWWFSVRDDDVANCYEF